MEASSHCLIEADRLRMQNIVPEGEWDAFMACLRTSLPITFRINGSGKFADALRRRLETDFLAGLVREGQQVLTWPEISKGIVHSGTVLPQGQRMLMLIRLKPIHGHKVHVAMRPLHQHNETFPIGARVIRLHWQSL